MLPPAALDLFINLVLEYINYLDIFVRVRSVTFQFELIKGYCSFFESSDCSACTFENPVCIMISRMLILTRDQLSWQFVLY